MQAKNKLPCEQALRDTLVAGQENEGQLATTSLEFENLHQKSQSEMVIGGDDISNDIITLGKCFSVFVYIRACFHFALIGGNLTAQSKSSHRGVGGGSPEMELQALLTFAAPLPECPEELARRLETSRVTPSFCCSF